MTFHWNIDTLGELCGLLFLFFMLGFCACHYLLVRKANRPETPCTCLKPTCVCRDEVPW